MQDRLGDLERRSEALWHVKEGGEELRVLVERLKTDVETTQATVVETQVGVGTGAAKLDSTGRERRWSDSRQMWRSRRPLWWGHW